MKKIIRQVTGTSKGVTFTKEELKIMDKDLGDIVEIKEEDKK